MRRSTAAVAGIATVLASCLSAAAYLAANRWFGASDLPGMAIWSLPLGGLVYWGSRLVGAKTARLSWPWRYLIHTLLGLGLGVLWTVVSAMLLGGWIMAFSFPVMINWIVGSLIGCLSALVLERPTTWVAALGLAAAAIGANLRLHTAAQAPPPRIRVVVKAGATPDEVNQVWQEVLGYPGPRGGHDLKAGISSVSATGYENNSPILTVSLWKGVHRERQDSLVAEIKSSPLVDRVEVVPVSEPAAVRRSVEY